MDISDARFIDQRHDRCLTSEEAVCASVLASFLRLTSDDGGSQAALLVKELGSLGGVLQSSFERLTALVPEGSAAAITLLRRLVERATALCADGRDIISNMAELDRHLRARIAWSDVEIFVVLFLDSANGLIASEVLGRGTVDQCNVYTREIIARALELRASGLVLAHNHPSDRAEPSRQDIRLTRTIAEAGRLLDIRVIDHIIMTRSGRCSLHELGHL